MTDIDIEKSYNDKEHIEKLQRLIDCMKHNKPYEIQVDGQRIYVPASATFSIEYEQEGSEAELEFQLKWKREDA